MFDEASTTITGVSDNKTANEKMAILPLLQIIPQI
jgi:hypothetical protein